MTALEQFIASARWFGGKGRDFHVTGIRRLSWLNPPEPGEPSAAGPGEPPWARIELVSLEYDDDGAGEVYQLPLAYYREPQARLEHALVGEH